MWEKRYKLKSGTIHVGECSPLQSYAKDPLMLIIKKKLNKRVTEGDASDPHDFIKTI